MDSAVWHALVCRVGAGWDVWQVCWEWHNAQPLIHQSSLHQGCRKWYLEILHDSTASGKICSFGANIEDEAKYVFLLLLYLQMIKKYCKCFICFET